MNKRHGLTLSGLTFWLFAEALFNKLNKIHHHQHQIHSDVRKLMAKVSIEQDDLDEIADTVSGVADSLQAVLDSETPLDPADESSLQAAVAKLQAVGPKVAPPADGGGETPTT